MDYDIEFLERIDQTIASAIQDLLEGKAEHQLNLSDLQLKIKLSGPAWAGIVDRPIAKFLVELDKVLTREFQSSGLPIPETKHGLVALQIEDGSLDAFLQYSKDTFKEFRKLKPAQQILVLLTILTALGIYKSEDIISELKKPELARIESGKELIHAQERVALVESASRIAENQRAIQGPIRSLISNMAPEDKISLPGTTEPLDREAATARLEKKTRSKVEQFYIDHPYKIDELNTKDPENWFVGLSFGDVAFKAKLLISEEEVNRLLKDFQEAHAHGTMIAPDLQVTARVSDKGITHAEVVGLGSARPNAVRLSEVLTPPKKVAKQDIVDLEE